MPGHEERSYFLYEIGKEEINMMSLGTLLLGDYVSPIYKHRTHRLLSSGEKAKYVSWTRIGGAIIDYKSSPKVGVSIDALDLIKFSPEWSASNEKLLVAESGERTEIKEPQEFLNNVVLRKKSPARKALQQWISASQVDYVLKLKWLRSPKVWMLSGQYLFDNASAVEVKKKTIGIEAGISSITVAALTGIPIGGSVDIKGIDKRLVVGIKWEEKLVWAAQYRLLEVDYLRIAEADPRAQLPNVVPLSERMSVGRMRNNNNTDNAFQVRLLGGESIDTGRVTDIDAAKKEEEYAAALLNAIEELESLEEGEEETEEEVN